MAFEYTLDRARIHGAGELVFGTFTNGAADLGGNIITGRTALTFAIGLTGTAVEVTASAVNEDFPSPGTVTVVNGTGDDGVYMGLVR